MDSHPHDSKRSIRLFGGAVLIVMGIGQIVFGIHRSEAQGIFVGVMASIAGVGLLAFGMWG